MVIVFDLDDTLYDEMTFVYSGFKVVSEYIEIHYGIEKELILKSLKEEVLISRSDVFNRTFNKFGIFTKKLLKKSISVYRTHFPSLALYKEAENCLKRFEKYPIYIVTDGNITAQKNKLLSLNLYNPPPIKKSILTYRYGIKRSKPSPYCFFQIARMEKTTPENIVYVADNPQKDFAGIKPYGFKTIRVLTGQHKDVIKSVEYEADTQIKNLDLLTEDFLKSIF